MPFAEIVEPCVIRAGSREEFIELDTVFIGMPDKARR
jgi:hypothetical protein